MNATNYFFLQMVLGLFAFFFGIFLFFWLLGFFQVEPIEVSAITPTPTPTNEVPFSSVDSSRRFQGMSGIIRG